MRFAGYGLIRFFEVFGIVCLLHSATQSHAQTHVQNNLQANPQEHNQPIFAGGRLLMNAAQRQQAIDAQRNPTPPIDAASHPKTVTPTPALLDEATVPPATLPKVMSWVFRSQQQHTVWLRDDRGQTIVWRNGDPLPAGVKILKVSAQGVTLK